MPWSSSLCASLGEKPKDGVGVTFPSCGGSVLLAVFPYTNPVNTWLYAVLSLQGGYRCLTNGGEGLSAPSGSENKGECREGTLGKEGWQEKQEGMKRWKKKFFPFLPLLLGSSD